MIFFHAATGGFYFQAVHRRQLTLTDGPIARHRDELDLGKITTLNQAQLLELTLYRASLRDWPASAAFPDLGARPEPPLWLEPLITP
ncbi:hypothetical protein [Pseudomonas aeruginosa]|uniref:hypothetical protein n=1 Tax=Pseudomonas aeruginosa TaxID=287 RepID=UPI001053AB58|nr:hypothetical protein [Pseudomonas aeruginosa]